MTEKQYPDAGRQKELRENVAAVRERIRAAAEAIGREEEVTLLLATKTVPPEDINFVIRECGIRHIGENRVQELTAKYGALEKDGVSIHFIGTLQKNKVRQIVDKVDMIESVDSVPLAREIDRQCAKIGKVMDVLIEVNIGEEEQKSGVSPEGLGDLIGAVNAMPNLNLRGLMTIGPVCAENEEYRKIFSKTYQIFLDISGELLHNSNRSILSMGMSDSYEIAVGCRSDLVRVGSAVFGKRHYPEKNN